MRHHRLAGLALIVLAAGLPCAGRAGDAASGRFSVNPTLVVLSPEATSALVSLTNESQGEMRFQLSAFAWDQSADGEMRLGPTDDIVYFPQLLALAPGESRNIRVATLAAAGASERSYRLFIEELPPSEADRKPGAVQMLTRVGIPVFVAPPSPVQAGEIQEVSRERGGLSFTLANTGTTHFVPEAITVKALARDGSVLGERSLTGWYVLPGGIRRFTTDLPGLSSPSAAEIVVEARVGQSVLTRRLDLATRVAR